MLLASKTERLILKINFFHFCITTKEHAHLESIFFAEFVPVLRRQSKSSPETEGNFSTIPFIERAQVDSKKPAYQYMVIIRCKNVRYACAPCFLLASKSTLRTSWTRELILVWAHIPHPLNIIRTHRFS